MKITVVGTGYVGLVAGACFAETGNEVLCVDIDEKKVAALKNGEIPIYEPGLEDIVSRNIGNNRLKFTSQLKEGVDHGSIIFIAVGTPQDEDGSADLTHVLKVAEGIGRHMTEPKIIVDKSTVPVGTAEKVANTIRELTDHEFDVVSNPEFLKEGAAIDDFMKPDRVVVGVSSENAARVMKELYAPFVRTNNPIIVMDVVSAEMTKYAANAMLATRISFMNEVANLCEKAGADVAAVRIGMGSDSRIGMSFLFPGIGYGGSCFPKDVQALVKTAKELGVNLKVATAVEEVNFKQKKILVEKIIDFYSTEDLKDKTFGVWGLAFKARTDDVREAPALVVCQELVNRGAKLKVFDPEARDTFRACFGENDNVVYAESDYDAAKGVDALVICTEWNEFRQPDFPRIKEAMNSSVVFDGRNLYDPEKMKDLGFTYISIGRTAQYANK